MNAQTKSKSKIRVEMVIVEKCADTDPDTSTIGEYTDNPENGSIERKSGEFVGDIRHRASLIDRLEDRIDYEETIHDTPDATKIARWYKRIDRVRATGAYEFSERNGHNYTFFTPYAGGETWRSPDYRKYAKQDFDQMEDLNAGNWCYVGIIAKARIVVNNTTQTIHSGGLWGIESNSDDAYMNEVAQEELADLADQLVALGIGKRGAVYAVKSWDGEFTDR